MSNYLTVAYGYDAIHKHEGDAFIYYNDDHAVLQKTSFFSRAWKFAVLRKHNNSCFQEIFALFQKHFNITNEVLFQKIWQTALAEKKISFKRGDTLSVKLFREIHVALEGSIIYSGEGVRNAEKNFATPAQHLIGFLLCETNTIPLKVINIQTVKAIFAQKDPELLGEFRAELQNALKNAINNTANLDEKKEVLLRTYIGNVLSLLPFAYPEKGFEMEIPQKINGNWQLVNYKVDEKIQLTPDIPHLISALPAYGMLPTNQTLGAPPLLLCIGTTYPAGDGYSASLLADFTPGLSVGQGPYLYGKKAIQSWLEGKKGVDLYGMSLGGATALHIVNNHRDKIAHAEIFSPPGLYWWNWTQEFNDECTKISIYTQVNDHVHSMGMFPTGSSVSMYSLLGKINGDGENPVFAHCRAHSAYEHVTIVKVDPENVNKSIPRNAQTVLHILLGPFVFFIPTLMITLVVGLLRVLYKIATFAFINNDNNMPKTPSSKV